MNLQLWDGETVVEIEVNDEDYNRAQNDINFAQTLLNHVKLMNKANQRSNSEDCEIQSPEMNNEEIQSPDEINNVDDIESPTPTQNVEEEDFHIATEGSKWTYNETLALITTMENYLNEINHSNPKKKKDAWSSISSELESLNVVKSADTCRLKWKNLLRSYSNCKTNNNKTGRKPTRFLFLEEMDQLVGQKPNFSSPHSFNVLSADSSAGTSKDSSPVRADTPSREDTDESAELTPRNKRKQQVVGVGTLKKRLLEKKVNNFEAQEVRREERHKEKIKLLERKILVDERKCELLERYLKLKEQEQNQIS